MSYWSDEAVQRRAVEQEEMKLQWKFRGITTSQLELRLENGAMSSESQKSIEQELIRRGATYIKRSYYERPSKYLGSDGSQLVIATASQDVGRTIYDWDNIIATEAAYVDKLMAKPIVGATVTQMSSFLKDQIAVVRRIVPGLIAMDICGVQPMVEQSMLPWFNMRKEEVLSKSEVDRIVAADKDLQPIQGNFWSDRQSIGRSQRPTVHFGDLHISDYMGLTHTETPKSSTAIAKLMESIKQSETTQASFFDTESTFTSTAISRDFFSKVDTTGWLDEYKASYDKYIVDALKQPNRYISDDSIKFMYPHVVENPCCEESSSPIFQGTEMTFSINNTSAIWDAYLHSMKAATRELYGCRVPMITAKAPRETSGLMIGTIEGIYPDRKPLVQDFFVGEMATYRPDTTITVHAEANALSNKSEMIVTIPKKRELNSGKLEVKFDYDRDTRLWESWAKECDKVDNVSETLAILGIHQGATQ